MVDYETLAVFVLILAALKLVWVFTALAGVTVGVLNLSDALADVRAMRERNINGVREYIARTEVRDEALRISSQSIAFIIGLISIPLPPPPTAQVTLSGILISFGIVLIEILIVSKSYLARFDRAKIRGATAKMPGQEYVRTYEAMKDAFEQKIAELKAENVHLKQLLSKEP